MKRIKILLAALVIMAIGTVQAQLNAGVTTAPVPSAVLQATSTSQGFLPPVMNNAQMTAIASPAAGLIVFCTDCSPVCLWNYNGTAWVAMCAATVNATFSTNTINCGGTLAGTYQASVAMTASNTKTISITTTTGGAYTASTGTVNGVTFSTSGTLSSTGAGTNVTMVASGTPTGGGSFTYTASLGGQTCTFSVVFAAAATFACGTATQTQSPSGALVNGTPYTGSYTINYTAGNGSSYASTTETVSGLTLTRVAGTLSTGSGSVMYNLTGTYTGATNGIVSFTIPECSTAVYGDALRAALAAGGCTSCTAYDAAAIDTWVSITAAEYAQIDNFVTVNLAASNETIMTQTGAAGYNSSGAMVSTGTNITTLPTNNYVVAFSAVVGGAAGSPTGWYLKYSTNATTGYSMSGPSLAITTLSAYTRIYNVLKKPSTVINVSSPSYVAIFQNSSNPYVGYINSAGSTINYSSGSGDNSAMANAGANAALMYQVKGTATKKW